MNLVKSRKRRVVAAVIVGSALLASGSAAAYAASTSPSSPSSTPSSTAAANAHRPHRSLLARADHATVEVRRQGKWVAIALDRGNVTAVSATSITLARPDGQSVTISLAPTTKYRGKQATSAATLKTGVRAQVTSINGTAIGVTEGAKPLPTK